MNVVVEQGSKNNRRGFSSYIQSYKDQAWLLLLIIEDMIPEDHNYYMVKSLVHSVDFSAFDAKYTGAGHPAYYTRTLLKILAMGVIDRVRSSRSIAKNARENVVYLYL